MEGWTILLCGESWVNPVPDGTSSTKWEPEKKNPALRVFFFLPAFSRCCPSVSAHPEKVFLCTQDVCTTNVENNIAIAGNFRFAQPNFSIAYVLYDVHIDSFGHAKHVGIV